MTSTDEAQRRRISIIVVDDDCNAIVLDSCNKTAIRHQKTPNRHGSNFGDGCRWGKQQCATTVAFGGGLERSMLTTMVCDGLGDDVDVIIHVCWYEMI